MIKGMCHTNLDEYQREEWPEKFVAVPSVGDWVQAKSGKMLRVVKITHAISTGSYDIQSGEPYIKVELHKL